MQEAQFQSLGWEDPLEKEMAIHSSILVWEIPWTVELKWAIVHRFAKELDRTQQLNNDNKNYWGVTPGSIFVVLEPLIIVTLNVYAWWNCVQPYTKKEIKIVKPGEIRIMSIFELIGFYLYPFTLFDNVLWLCKYYF